LSFILNGRKLLSQMNDFLGYNKNDLIDGIYKKHEELKETAWNFNTGKIYRWKKEIQNKAQDYNQLRKWNMKFDLKNKYNL